MPTVKIQIHIEVDGLSMVGEQVFLLEPEE